MSEGKRIERIQREGFTAADRERMKAATIRFQDRIRVAVHEQGGCVCSQCRKGGSC